MSASENAGRTMMEADRLRAEVEPLREQLEVHERWIESYGHPEEWVKRAQAAHGRAEAAEAERDRLAHALRHIAGEEGYPDRWYRRIAREALASLEEQPMTRGHQ